MIGSACSTPADIALPPPAFKLKPFREEVA